MQSLENPLHSWAGRDLKFASTGGDFWTAKYGKIEIGKGNRQRIDESFELSQRKKRSGK